MLQRPMVEVTEPDNGVQHWKLGFEALCIRAVHGGTRKENVSAHGISHWSRGDTNCRGTTMCPCTHGRCHLVMNKVKTSKAYFQPTAASCVHGCFVKLYVASLCKLVVHNEPIKCSVAGCPDWVFSYNME